MTVVDLSEKRAERQRAELTGTWRDCLVYVPMPNGGHKLGSIGANAISILRFDDEWQGVLAWDDFASKVVTLKSPPFHDHDSPSGGSRAGAWADEDSVRTAAFLARRWGLKLGADTVGEAVRVVAKATAVHPVRAYLDGLRWDGTPRIDRWLVTYVGAAETPYSLTVGRWWLVSGVARVMRPGCKADHALILEGSQGIGKSTALRVLAGDWFSDTPIDLDSKDAYLAMRGRWIVELAELESLTRAEAARVKAFFSSAVDTFRPPYGRETIEAPRQCIFGGSVNHGGYLRDETGGRRFWPVACGKVDLPALRRDRDQLWAEAKDAFAGGATWWPATEDEHAACAEQQAERYAADEWENKIGGWVGPKPSVAMGDVLTDCLGLEIGRCARGDEMRAAAALRRLGFERVKRTADGKRVWLYERTGRGST